MTNKIEMFEEFEGDLEEYRAYLARISEIILEFEQRLSDNGVGRPFVFDITNEQSIRWGLYGKRYRLAYVNKSLKIDRPLIECKIDIRRLCIPFLKRFMQKIVEELCKEIG